MLSEIKGAVLEIQKHAKNALRTPCYSHKLNLSLSKSNQVIYIRNAVGTMKSCISFLDDSPKRCNVLRRMLGHQFTGLCETRWVERHDGVLQFTVDLPKIINCLEEISQWADSSTSSKASQLIAALTDSFFLVSLFCLSDVLALTLPLSILMQKKSLTLDTAADDVSNLLTILSDRRKDPERHFATIWQKINDMSERVDVEIRLPRRCGRQGNRANYATDSAEAYFRLAVFNPLLDNVIVDLKDRFRPSVLEVFNLPWILPINLLQKPVTAAVLEQKAKELVNSFSSVLPCDSEMALLKLKGELELWHKKCGKIDFKNLPESSGAVLQECDEEVYPIIHSLLLILTTLPVSSATAERSFSALRRLKTWLRSTMQEERLTGLALMLIHRDIDVNIENVINRFAKSGNRRVDFIL